MPSECARAGSDGALNPAMTVALWSWCPMTSPRERSPERAHDRSAERSPEQGEIARLTVLLTAADARAKKADLKADRAEQRAEQTEQRADAAILRADAADADRRSVQARSTRRRAGPGGQRIALPSCASGLMPPSWPSAQAEEAAELARSQATHAHKSVAELRQAEADRKARGLLARLRAAVRGE